MKQIVKITFSDGTELEAENIKPLELDGTESYADKYKKEYFWQKQFNDFEDEILGNIQEHNIKHYAEWNLEIKTEDDIEEKEIEDFTDDELLEELRHRRRLSTTNIVNEDFLDRFSKIAEKENSIFLEDLLTTFEKRLNLI